MIGHPGARILAVALTTLAGFVDAIGFLASGGFFVSFMSGNSTQLGVDGVQADRAALTAGLLIAAFVAGAAAGSLAARRGGAWQRPMVMGLVTTAVAASALLQEAGADLASLATLAIGMGSQNGVFARDGNGGLGVTYVTGVLVRIGHGFAARLTGDRSGDLGFDAMLWLGLVSGAAGGAMLFGRLALDALWVALAGAGALTLLTLHPRLRRN